MSGDPSREAPKTKGVLIRWARLYDIVVRVISLGGEEAMRDQTVLIACKPG